MYCICVILESGVGEDSEMLAQCSHFETSNRPGKFPDLTSHLDFFKVCHPSSLTL